MNIIKTLAGIFSGIIIFKSIGFAASPKFWLSRVKLIFQYGFIVKTFLLFSTLIVGYFVFIYFTFAEMATMMLFTSLLYALTLYPIVNEIFKDEAHEKEWLFVVQELRINMIFVWLVFAGLVIFELMRGY